MTRQGVALAAVSSLRAEVSGTVMESWTEDQRCV